VDESLKKALEFSNYNHTLSVQRKTMKEKMSAKLTYGYNGGIFKIDQSLMIFVDMLVNQGRTSGIPIIDSNGNPILIDDMESFKDEIFDRYFTTLIEYYEEFEKIKKNRSVEKLVDL
jgi:hypothetical protein